MEHQILATYWALIETEAFTGPQLTNHADSYSALGER